MAEWEFNPLRPSCETCSVAWKDHETPTHEDRARIGTTCYNCPKPFLLPENWEAWSFYELIYDQVIVSGMGDIIGLHKGTVLDVLRVFGVRDPEDLRMLLEKIMAIHGVAMKFMQRSRETKQRARRNPPHHHSQRRRHARA